MKFSYYRIKLFIGARVLERRLKKKSKRTMRSCNINDAKSLGMLCVIKNKDDYESIIKIIDNIKSEFTIPKIKILAFYPLKDEPFFLKSRLGLDFFTVHDLNFYAFPNNIVVRNFINESFDIILDLTANKIIPLRLILYFSKSPFKVGSFSNENKPFYDLMIETDPGDYLEYIKQVVNYLKIFNKK